MILTLLSALWLGVLTSISPCPLATNIAAVAFVGRKVESPGRVALAGLLYTLGRAAVYVLLGALLVASLVSAPVVSNVLQRVMNRLLGPVLILVGLFLLDLIAWNFSGWAPSEATRRRIEKAGAAAPLLLGALFALAFCPVSAALFFGSLIPLSVANESILILPATYGIGTGLPVAAAGFVLGFGIFSIGRFFEAVTRFEKRARQVTGIVFLGVGGWFLLGRTFHLIG